MKLPMRAQISVLPENPDFRIKNRFSVSRHVVDISEIYLHSSNVHMIKHVTMEYEKKRRGSPTYILMHRNTRKKTKPVRKKTTFCFVLSAETLYTALI